MDKEDMMVHPFQGHVRKNIEKRGTTQLFVPEGACLIAARDRDTVYECMVVVAQHGHEPEVQGKIADDLKARLRLVAPVQDIAKVDQGIDRAKTV
jgi:hypothetical protein